MSVIYICSYLYCSVTFNKFRCNHGNNILCTCFCHHFSWVTGPISHIMQGRFWLGIFFISPPSLFPPPTFCWGPKDLLSTDDPCFIPCHSHLALRSVKKIIPFSTYYICVEGDGLNDVSFSPGLCKGSFAATPDPYSSGMSLNQSWSFYNYIGGGQSGMAFPTTVRNPNKAICTIDANTSEVGSSLETQD